MNEFNQGGGLPESGQNDFGQSPLEPNQVPGEIPGQIPGQISEVGSSPEQSHPAYQNPGITPGVSGLSTPGAISGSVPPGGLQADSVVPMLMEQVRNELESRIIGQEEVIEQIMICLLAGGHVLLEGKPGLGKTQLVLTLSKLCNVSFGRIQFTPDLMPADVTGHSIYDMSSQQFVVRQGPVFTNFLLADEINRAPAKTQAALLEVMQERQVTIDGKLMKLDAPFMVLATQNPIEHEGTYQLPEAQLDRFLLKVLIDYPAETEEQQVVNEVAAWHQFDQKMNQEITAICDSGHILEAQTAVSAIQATDSVVNFAVRLVRATRESTAVSIGAGTRGAIALVRCAKAAAVIDGRNYVIPDDVKRLAIPALRHRITISPELAISGQDADDVLHAIIETVEAPRS